MNAEKDCVIFLDSDNDEPASSSCKYLCSDEDDNNPRVSVMATSRPMPCLVRHSNAGDDRGLQQASLPVLIKHEANEGDGTRYLHEEEELVKEHTPIATNEEVKARFLDSDEEENLPDQNSGFVQPTVINDRSRRRSTNSANTRERRTAPVTTTATTPATTPAPIRRARSRRTVRNDEESSEEEYQPGESTSRRVQQRRGRRINSQPLELLRPPPAAVTRPTTPSLRPPSTRREARRANIRISMSNNILDSSSTDDESFEDEKIIRIDEISMASEEDDERAPKFLTDGEDDVDRSFMCIICAEPEALKPVKTTCCEQPVGCRTCVKRWYRTTNISELNARSPLSRGQSHDNHKRCLFCRTPWPTRMLIVAM